MMFFTAPEPGLIRLIAIVFASLCVGSVVRFIAIRHADEDTRRKRLESLRTWWILAAVVSACLLVGRAGLCALMTIVSGLAFREYTRLLQPRPDDRNTVLAVYAVIVANYLLLLFGLHDAFLVFVPLAATLAVAVLQLLTGRTEGYIRATAGLAWGSLVLVYALSHCVLLTVLPETSQGPAGFGGWFLFLVFLTETNDIAQALVGRRFGAHKKHRITPAISPNKTWEGFLGGMCVTTLLSVVLAPWMTDLPQLPLFSGAPGWLTAALIGPLLAVSGFFGDINMSAVKRDAGVKDSSSLLPGMGGMIDRIDSLTFTAPAFAWLVMLLGRLQ